MSTNYDILDYLVSQNPGLDKIYRLFLGNEVLSYINEVQWKGDLFLSKVEVITLPNRISDPDRINKIITRLVLVFRDDSLRDGVTPKVRSNI